MTSFVDVHLHPPLERFLASNLAPLVPSVPGDAYQPKAVDDIAADVGYSDGVTLRTLLRRKTGCGVRELRTRDWAREV